jgi:hypothetical protein
VKLSYQREKLFNEIMTQKSQQFNMVIYSGEAFSYFYILLVQVRDLHVGYMNHLLAEDSVISMDI